MKVASTIISATFVSLALAAPLWTPTTQMKPRSCEETDDVVANLLCRLSNLSSESALYAKDGIPDNFNDYMIGWGKVSKRSSGENKWDPQSAPILSRETDESNPTDILDFDLGYLAEVAAPNKKRNEDEELIVMVAPPGTSTWEGRDDRQGIYDIDPTSRALEEKDDTLANYDHDFLSESAPRKRAYRAKDLWNPFMPPGVPRACNPDGPCYSDPSGVGRRAYSPVSEGYSDVNNVAPSVQQISEKERLKIEGAIHRDAYREHAKVERRDETSHMSNLCKPVESGPLVLSNANGTMLRVKRWNEYTVEGLKDAGLNAEPMTQDVVDLSPSEFTFYACNLPSMGYTNGVSVAKGKEYFGKIIFGTDYAHADGELDGLCLQSDGAHGFNFAKCDEDQTEVNLRQWFRLQDLGTNKIIDYYPKANTADFTYESQDLKHFEVDTITGATPLYYGSETTGWTLKMGLF